jgi:hypothetical protein
MGDKVQNVQTSVTDDNCLGGSLTLQARYSVEGVNAVVQEKKHYCHRYTQEVGYWLWICVLHQSQ